MDYRAEKEASRRKGGGDADPGSEQVPSSSSHALTPSKTGSAGAASSHRSVYREILYLTLVSLGQVRCPFNSVFVDSLTARFLNQDNIDLTAFDREFRRAFDKLPSKWEEAALRCDRPPSMQTLFCRKLYRNLTL